jgi:hypothetical protein
MVAAADANEIARVEVALQEWRQGDATLDAGLFLVHLADKRLPLTQEARASLDQALDEGDIFDVFSSVHGLVVVTQTCDIVKECARSEFIDVSPLVHIEKDTDLSEIQKGKKLRYAYVPGVAGRQLVADLERTMAVEKAVVATWRRVPGCTTDEERVAFADALARKRQRFAFPTEFNRGMVKFKNRLKDRKKKNSVEGQLINALDHVRAAASPSWNSSETTVMFWFLLRRDQDIDFDQSRHVIDGWMKLITLSTSFTLSDPPFALVEQEDMTVRDYLASHPLDYDDLSM